MSPGLFPPAPNLLYQKASIYSSMSPTLSRMHSPLLDQLLTLTEACALAEQRTGKVKTPGQTEPSLTLPWLPSQLFPLGLSALRTQMQQTQERKQITYLHLPLPCVTLHSLPLRAPGNCKKSRAESKQGCQL